MGVSIEVDRQSFETEVLQRSDGRVVLVDFLAQWCGPCQLLKPMLEKLVAEYDFVLAKVDIDHSPELAQAYGVEGVPDVRVVKQGQVLDGFVGVLEEAQLRSLLTQLGLTSTLEQGLAELAQLRATGDVAAAQGVLNRLIEQYPDSAPVMLSAAEFLIEQNRLDSAQKLLSGAAAQAPRELMNQIEGLQKLVEFQQTAQAPQPEAPLDRLYQAACEAAVQKRYDEALASFLEIVQQDRRYRSDGARKAMIGLFKLLGEDSDLTRSYRKRLMQTLY
ncbi:MAG: tetratricopeptide repeat protein [Leptolyngbya sp. SIO4C1]|nr:tetratricopeptide repeat protein [Leptolyngbya sp. SIO4C1]